MEASKLAKKLDFRSVALLLSGIIIGSVTVFFALQAGTVDSQLASEQLISTLEQNSGQQLELVNTEQQNGLYKIQVRDSENTLRTYFMTKDGRYITQESNLVDFEQFQARTVASNRFSECMQNRDVVFFGNRSQQATAAQIQLLGGANQVSGYYADVQNNRTLSQAAQLGVSRIPAFYYNESVAEGVQSINQLEEFTGCTYNVTG